MGRISQIDDDHCGPAVLEMLTSQYNVSIPQADFVVAAGIQRKILTHGMFVEEMGLAVSKLAPHLQFWYKRDASLRELSSLVNQFHFPVGVEWQGIFEKVYFDDPDDSFGEEDEADDDVETGHYSIVTGIQTSSNWITLADPYHNRGTDRQITILEFERRWWDINEIIDPKTGKRREQDDYHTLFFVTPTNTDFPVEMDLIQYLP